MAQKTIALLPMKANSERISGKNFKLFAGKPLYCWILDALLKVSSIDQVVINTDARDVLLQHRINESEKITIRDRKTYLCGDDTSMNLIIADDLDNTDADTYLMTHATNPLLESETISSAIKSYLSNTKYDSLFTVRKIQSRFYRKDMTPVNHNPDNLVRTQDLEPWYEENSCLYIFSKNSFHRSNARIGLTPQMFETQALESIDIDEHHDWVIAEALMLKNIAEKGKTL